MRAVSNSGRLRRAALFLGVAAILGIRALPAAAQHEHHHHPNPQQPETPAPVKPASQDRRATAAEEPARAAVDFTFRPTRAGASGVQVGEEAELRIRVTDPATGAPVRGLVPMGWIDVRAAEPTSLEVCRQKMGVFMEGTLHVKHGQMNITKPVEDLNGHYILALARSPQVVVVDPLKGFGRTKLFTTVLLPGVGEDWASTPDDSRVFVSIPEIGKVAVISTHTWRVETVLDAGARPTRVAMDRAGRLWVVDAAPGGAVRVIDSETLEQRAALPAGPGPHALAFSADGRFAFVTSAGAGTVTVVDAATLAPLGDVRTGDRPVDAAWSTARGALFVAHAGDGTVAVVDPAARAVVERVQFSPGLSFIRFAPGAPAAGGEHEGHGPHGGHGMGIPGADRLAFVVNPAEGTLHIYDAEAREVIRRLSGAPEPDQIGFSAGFAYVRAAGTASVAMIPLAEPRAGAVGPHDYFPAGGKAPGSVTGTGLGDLVIAQPGMHDAVYVLNPVERMIYSYHYMEGMPVPHGGLTTYGFDPRSIRTVSRRMREIEPGVYAATVRMERAGDFDLVVRIQEPYALGCHGFSIRADPDRLHDRLGVESAMAGRTLRPGPNAVRFRLTDRSTGEPLTAVEDFNVQFASTDGFMQLVHAGHVGDGVYEARVELPGSGVYYAVYQALSYGIARGDRSAMIFNVRDDD